MLIAKLYNLAQKFAIELEVATAETFRQIQQGHTSHGRGQSTSYKDMMDMHATMEKPGKFFDEAMIEPLDSLDGQQDELMGGGAAASKRQSRQPRTSDGKFQQSGYNGYANRKGGLANAFPEFGLSRAETGGRKTKEKKRAAGGGDVGRAFYDASLPQPDSETGLTSSLSSQLCDDVG